MKRRQSPTGLLYETSSCFSFLAQTKGEQGVSDEASKIISSSSDPSPTPPPPSLNGLWSPPSSFSVAAAVQSYLWLADFSDYLCWTRSGSFKVLRDSEEKEEGGGEGETIDFRRHADLSPPRDPRLSLLPPLPPSCRWSGNTIVGSVKTAGHFSHQV